MTRQSYQMARIAILGIVMLFLMMGCHGGSNSTNPIMPQSPFEKSGPGNLDTLPIIAFDGETALGVMGGYNLTISNDGKNAELVPMRSATIGEAYIVSGTSFFTMTPCNDCLRIDKVALDINENIVLTMSVKHPFPKGDVSKPPSSTNRLDLDIFDLALVVKPLDIDPDYYPLIGAYVYAGIVRNTDGYTNELTGVTGENSILPYKICYENANHNRFAMGTGFQPFDVVFSPGDNLNFDLYLTMAYGASARKTTRLTPTYYVPEFNRKPAWKVEIEPVSWVMLDPSTVTIKVYDWNHGATVDPNYPDPDHQDRISAKSDVLSVTVEVPGMINSIITANAIDTTTNGWDDPLTYSATFSNERGAGEGIHFGLVKVVDSKIPGTSVYGGESDTLVHSTGTEPSLEWYEIPEFVTYQTFIATVIDEGILENDNTEPYNDPNYPGVVIPVAERQLIIYYEDGMYAHILDLIDNSSNSYLVGQILEMNTVQVIVADGVSLNDVRQYYESDSTVIYARPNYIISNDIYPSGEPDATSAPFADRRWHFDQVQAPQAWDLISPNDSTVKVGFVDSGLDPDNFDGKDFKYISSNLPDIKDNEGHGTHVAGIIAASGFNHTGTLGMAWKSELYPYKLHISTALSEMRAVRTLVNKGCKVINVSMGFPLQRDVNRDGDYDDWLLWGDYYVKKADRQKWAAEHGRFPFLNEFKFCKARNVVLIKAAGNDYNKPMIPSEPGEDGHFQDDIPIGHHVLFFFWVTDYDAEQFKTNFPNILFVAATKRDDNYSDFSNRGLVHRISAPGQRIYSSYSTNAPNPNLGFEIENNGQSAYASGTSMAAPMVSGLASLILSKNNGLTAQAVVNKVINTADPGPDVNTGRINAFKAIGGGSQPEGDGNLIWAKSAGAGGTYNDFGYAVTILSDNSTVMTGEFSGTATFGPGEPNQTVLTSSGACDISIARYNQNGILAWAKRAGGPSSYYYYERGCGISTLSDNSTVVTGCFQGTATFGPGEPNEAVLTSAGRYDIFIARYNPDGTLAWAKHAGGASEDQGYAATTLWDNSTIVTGWFRGTATFGESEPNETILIVPPGGFGGINMFIARYYPNGTLAWAKRAGTAAYTTEGCGITTLSDNSTVVTGWHYESTIFGEGEPNETILPGKGIFIARYHYDGTLAWAKNTGAGYDSSVGREPSCATTTLSDNSIIVTGSFMGTATFGLGEPNQTVLSSFGYEDVFVARYNSSGTLVWAKHVGGGSAEDRSYGITKLSDNSTVMTGSFRGTATFGPGELHETLLASDGENDIFIARYNPNGTLSWVKHAGGTNYDDIGYGITTLSDNSTVATGSFRVTAVFGPDEPNQTFLYSTGGADIFIARFAP